MKYTVCIKKAHDSKGRVTHYLLSDRNGNTNTFASDLLKYAIKEHEIKVLNLTLKSNNSLIMSNEAINKSESFIEAERYIIKNLYTDKVELINANKDKYVYMARLSEMEEIIYIPDDVVNIDNLFKEYSFNNLSVYGGRHVMSMENTFYGVCANSINLDNFCPNCLVSINNLFSYAQVSGLVTMENWKSNNLESMDESFSNSCIGKLNIKNINTSNVKTKQRLLENCKTEIIGVKTSKLSISKETDN